MVSVLYCTYLCMKSSLGISNFLEKISSLSHSKVFLWFFALITEEGFLNFSLLFLGNSALRWGYFSFSALPFTSLLFSDICKACSENHFAFLHFFFLGIVFITTSCTMSHTSIHSSSGTLFVKSNVLCLSSPLSNHKRFDLGLSCMASWFSLFSLI